MSLKVQVSGVSFQFPKDSAAQCCHLGFITGQSWSSPRGTVPTLMQAFLLLVKLVSHPSAEPRLCPTSHAEPGPALTLVWVGVEVDLPHLPFLLSAAGDFHLTLVIDLSFIALIEGAWTSHWRGTQDSWPDSTQPSTSDTLSPPLCWRRCDNGAIPAELNDSTEESHLGFLISEN
jgi:hypothetical protein